MENQPRPAISYLVEIYKRAEEEKRQERRWGWLRKIRRGFSQARYALRYTLPTKIRFYAHRFQRWMKGGSFFDTPEDRKRRLGWVIFEETGFPVIQDYCLSQATAGVTPPDGAEKGDQ